MHGCDPFLLKQSIDLDHTIVHVKYIRVNPSLYNNWWQVDTFCSKGLDKRLGDDAAAHVASVRTGNRKITWFIYVYMDGYVNFSSHFQKKIAKK